MYNANVAVQIIGAAPGLYLQPINVSVPHIRSLEDLKEKIKPEVDKQMSAIIQKLKEDKETYDRDHH